MTHILLPQNAKAITLTPAVASVISDDPTFEQVHALNTEHVTYWRAV